jgi:hypothetical protein
MRSKAASVSNPNSLAQLDHRAKFSTVLQFLKSLTALLSIGFKNQTVKLSGFNAAMSYNLKNAISGVYPAYEIDYAKALISEINLPEPLNPACVSTVAGEVKFTWEDNSQDGGTMADDKAILVVYNPVRKKSVNIVGGNTRTSGSQIVTLPSNFSGDEVQCFIGFQNANQSVLSDSQFGIGLIVL